MTLDELTQLTALQQTIITRHDQKIVAMREADDRRTAEFDRRTVVLLDLLERAEVQRQQDNAAFDRRIIELDQRMAASQAAFNQRMQELEQQTAAFQDSLRQAEVQRQQDTAAAQQRQVEADRQMAELRQGTVANQRMAELNQERLNTLMAGLEELRILVANYLQGRSTWDSGCRLTWNRDDDF